MTLQRNFKNFGFLALFVEQVDEEKKLRER